MRALARLSILLLSLALGSCALDDADEAVPADSLAAVSDAEIMRIDTTLHDSLRRIEARSGGRLGFAAIHLESGWRTVYGGTETYPLASVAKLPMAVAFLRMVDSEHYRLDTTVRLTRDDHRPGASRVYHRTMRDSGGAVSLHALLVAMLAESDNTASDFILRLAGGPRVADDMMRRIGLEAVDISSYEGELILQWAGVDPMASDSAWTRDRMYAKMQEAGKEAWEAAQARLVDDPRDAAPPEPLARLLVALARGRILSPAMTDTVLSIMSRAVTGRGRLPGLLPPGTPVAHKTGTIGSVANDVGIVTLPNGERVAIAALIKDSRLGMRARDRAIAAAASLVYQRLSKGPSAP
ncbi:MAG TPA: serine hydrolase [Candidatus Kapabacteria bacterium]|nr:serine hydrolase [Candidatus Kapabacteria bacterium]